MELNGEIATDVDKVSVIDGSLADGQSITAVTLTGSSTAAVTTSGTITTSAATIKSGTTDVTANYDISYADGVLTVVPIKAKVTTAPTAKTGLKYTGEAQALLNDDGTADNAMEYAFGNDTTTAPTEYSTTVPSATNADTYYIWYRAAADANHYASDPAVLTVTIARAAATVKAENKSKEAGDDDPAFTATVAGTYGSDALTYSFKLWERNINDLGAVYWQEIHRPYQTAGSGVTVPYSKRVDTHLSPDTTQTTTAEPVATGKTELPGGIELLSGQTYTTETFTESKTTGGWKVTYETIYTYIYNADGTLYATHKDGPNEIERVQVFEQQTDLSRDAAAIETNIQAEVIRVSNGLEYRRDIAASVLAGLNADRAGLGLAPLTMTYDSDAGRLSTIFAADMAKYNYGDIESPLYGTVEELAKRYGVEKAVYINVWRCGEKSADEINTRLQTAESSRNVRMDGSKANVGISIVAQNGFFYIAEVFTE